MDLPDGLYRSVVEASTDGLWITDEQGRTLHANDRMAEILGVTAAELVDLDLSDFHDEVGREQLREHFAERGRAEVGQDNVDTMLLRRDGVVVWVLASYSPLRGDSGARTGWLYRITPYTKRKELMEQLQEREHQLANAQAIAQIGSWEWDVQQDVMVWSDQLYVIFGAERAELPHPSHLGFMAYVHPDDLEQTRAEVDSSWVDLDGFIFEHRTLRPSGEVRWLRHLGRVTRAPDGSPLRMDGTVQDVTDELTADLRAAEAGRRLQLLQQMAVAANTASSLDEAIALARTLQSHSFGRWQASCVYRVVGDADNAQLQLLDTFTDRPVSPDPGLAESARISGTVETGTPNALQGTHSLLAMPIAVRGEVVSVVEVLAEEVPLTADTRHVLVQIAAQLSQVAEREWAAAELAEARDEAMEASRLKSEFLATMSHEIRTPMNGVVGLTQLLLRTQLDEQQRQLAHGLQSAGSTLMALINDILDLSKIEAGKLELETSDFDVWTVFDQASALLIGPAHAKGLELLIDCHPDVPNVLRGDATRLGQVLTNLGSNAVKFTDHGQVVIRVRLLESTASGVLLGVEVIDTGAGIASAAQAGLFDAFTQADPSTTRRHGGTGLGLAISDKLVRALGGELSVLSEPGRGSTFSFTARLQHPTSTTPHRDPRPLTGKRVVFLEANDTRRVTLERWFTAWGAVVEAVPSVPELRRVLGHAASVGASYDIGVLDCLEAARVVHDALVAPPALVLLSSDQTLQPGAVQAAGFTTLLRRPIGHAALYDALVAAGAPETDPGPATDPDPGPQPALGRTVLVVEDNPVNQMVASGLLESLGYTVHLAADGVEAVARLRGEHAVAAVLMDCRMPRMDGFEATRRIRALEAPGQRVPIIAMTASALQGERERCLAAGMDDFLTKPVDAVALGKVMVRWTAREPADPVLDLDRVAMLDGLVKDGRSFFQRTAESFLRSAEGQLRAIQDAIAAKDAHGALNAAHSMKGSALNLGLPGVAAAAARVELHAEAGSTAGTEPLMAEVEAQVQRAVLALRDATASHR